MQPQGRQRYKTPNIAINSLPREELTVSTVSANDARYSVINKEKKPEIVEEIIEVTPAISTVIEQKQPAETRERKQLDREVDPVRNLEKQKQIVQLVKTVEKEFSSLSKKFFVKMREEQYDKAGFPLNPEKYGNYMNSVYSDARNYMPFENDLLFSVRDNSLTCVTGGSIQKVDLASFDLKGLDDNSQAQVLQDIMNKWKNFVSSRK